MHKIKPVAGCVVGDWGLVDPFMAREVNDESLWDEPHIVKLYDQSAIDALRAEVERLSAALQKIASDEWEPGCGFCHPEGCESPSVARAAMQGDA